MTCYGLCQPSELRVAFFSSIGGLNFQDRLFLEEENTRRRGVTEYVAPKWPKEEEVFPKITGCGP